MTKLPLIVNKIKNIGPVLPGSLDTYYNVCGKPTCCCKDKKMPRKHGPYYRLSYSLAGKNSSMFVKKEDAKAVEKMVNNYKDLRALTIEFALETLKSIKSSGVNFTVQQAHQLSAANNKSDFWKEKNRNKSDAFRTATVRIRDLTASRTKWKKECMELRTKNKDLQHQVDTYILKEQDLKQRIGLKKKRHSKV